MKRDRKILALFAMTILITSSVAACHTGRPGAGPSRDEIARAGMMDVDVDTYCDVDENWVGGGRICIANPQEGLSIPFVTNIETGESTTEVAVEGKVRLVDTEILTIFSVSIRYTGSEEGIIVEGPVYLRDSVTDEDGNVEGERLFNTTFHLPAPGPYEIAIDLVPADASGGIPIPIPLRFTRNIEVIGDPNLSFEGGFAIARSDDGGCWQLGISPGGNFLVVGGYGPPGSGRGPGGMEERPLELHHSTMDLCVTEVCGEGEHCNTGSEMRVVAVNRINDGRRVVQPLVTTEGGGGSQCGDQSFACPGYFVTVPLGQGENKITLFGVNPKIEERCAGSIMEECAYPEGGKIELSEFQNMIDGPDICVLYLKRDGTVLGEKDGRPIGADEEILSQGIVVDVRQGNCPDYTAGRTRLNTMPRFCRESGNECAGTPNSICIKRENDARFVNMCPFSGGTVRHQYLIQGPSMPGVPGGLHYPINILTIKAFGEDGGVTEKVESFGLGDVTSLYEMAGTRRWRIKDDYQVPNALAAFISSGFLTREIMGVFDEGVDIKGVVEQALNTDKFKKEMFLDLLKPVPPTPEEVAQCHDTRATATAIQTMKMYPFRDGEDHVTIGNIEVLDYYMFDNKIGLRLHIDELRARVEVLSMRFQDADNDGELDLKDADADNDGICNDPPAVSGECELYDRNPNSDDDDSDGIPDAYDDSNADEDDDNDGVADENDLIGASELIRDDQIDPSRRGGTMGFYILPIRLKADDLYLNVQLEIKEMDDGRMGFDISEIPSDYITDGITGLVYIVGFNPGSEAVVEDGESIGMVDFECRREWSLTRDPHGNRVRIDRDQCERIARASRGLLNNSGLMPSPSNRNVDQMLTATLDSMFSCNMPLQIRHNIDEYRNKKLLRVVMPMMGKDFVFDTYSDLLGGDMVAGVLGLSVKGPGLVLTAGAYEEGEGDTAGDAKEFMNSLAPYLISNGVDRDTFGPILRPRSASPANPIDTLWNLGRDIGIAFNEEMVNMLLHSVNTLLIDVDRDDPNFLAIDQEKALEDLGVAFATGEGDECINADNENVTTEDPTCLPINLDVAGVFGGNLFSADLNGDGEISDEGDNGDSSARLTLAISPNLHTAITAGLISSTPPRDYTGRDPIDTDLSLEIGLSNLGIAIYPDGRVEGVADDDQELRGTWCDGIGGVNFYQKRYFPSEMNETLCGSDDPAPIVRLNVSGRLTLKVELQTRMDYSDDGWSDDYGGFVIRANGGLERRWDGASGRWVTDESKSYLIPDVSENNTNATDELIENNLKVIFATALSKMKFMHPQMETIEIPLKLITEMRRQIAEEPDIDTSYMIDQLGDFGLFDVEISRVMPAISERSPKYLGLGMDVGFCYADANDTCR